MTTSPVMGITEELLAALEAEANASLGIGGTGFVERVTGFSVIDLVAEVRRLREALAHNPAPAVRQARCPAGFPARSRAPETNLGAMPAPNPPRKGM